MREKKYLVWIICGLYFGWFFLAGYSDHIVEVVSRYVPVWFATLAMASWLVVVPITERHPPKPRVLRVSLVALFIISGLSVPIVAHFYPLGTALLGGLLCIEVFWLIPQWKKKWSRVV